MFIVGETIRVLNKEGIVSRRAFVSCVNDNGSYDIIYLSNSARNDRADDEECEVEASRVRQLEPFEKNSTRQVLVSNPSSEGYTYMH